MKLTHVLAWLGVTPFSIGLILTALQLQPFGISGHNLFTVYSLVILCFMAGTLWGQAIVTANYHGRYKILLASNGLALLGCFGFLFFSQTHFIYIACALFLVLLAVEGYQWKNNTILLVEYWPLRVQVTTVVAIHHLAISLV